MTPSHPLLEVATITGPIPRYLARIGGIVRTFDAQTQDSGNVSYVVEVYGERYFVKTAGDPAATTPYLDFGGRVALLRTAVRLAHDIAHPAVPPVLAVIESEAGPVLVYRFRPGELLHDRGAAARFRALPADVVLRQVDTVYDVHGLLCGRGWVACDFYDGCLIYDAGSDQLTIIDLDAYWPGPVVNTMGRMFGSERFMAPEEFTLGARIDARTTVFTLARAAFVLTGADPGDRDGFSGGPAAYDVLVRATRPDPRERHGTVAEFVTAWAGARA